VALRGSAAILGRFQNSNPKTKINFAMTLLNTLIPSLSRTPARQDGDTSNAGPTIRPAYDIKETPEAWGLTVFLPGVTKEALEITAEEGQLRIAGRRTWKQPEGWTALYRETADAPFELVLSHEGAVDADKIAAELRDGVLRLSLPKHEALKPRKIAVS
jgi:HSP20 family protein